MNTFWKRTFSGCLYVATIVGSLWLYPNFPLFNILIALVAALAVREFHRLMQDGWQLEWMSAMSAVALNGVFYMWSIGSAGRKMLVVYLMLMIIALCAELFIQQKNPITRWGHLLVGQAMVAIPLSMMNLIVSRNVWLMLALFVIIWVNDTGAYCVGSLTARRKGGNHKMFARVSPSKSWEGLIGGIICSLCAGYVFSLFVADWTWWEWMGMAFVIALFGTFGDLMESLMKRTIGVKDSGCFMPGHGGVLDRFDSLLLATPALFMVLLFI